MMIARSANHAPSSRIAAIVVAFVLSALLVMTNIAFAAATPAGSHHVGATEASDSKTADPTETEIRSAIESHQVQSPDGLTLFDAASAASEGIDARIIEVGNVYNDIVRDQATLTDDAIADRDLNPTNYGNWCGAKNSGPGEPINSLDRACMGHDHCLNINRPTCDCDREFIDRLRAIRGEYPWSNQRRARSYLEAAIIAVPTWHLCFI